MDPDIIFVPIDPTEQLQRQVVYEPGPAGRPVTTITREMRHHSLLAAAEARCRAVELADGGGILALLPAWCATDDEDAKGDEPWDGSPIDRNEVWAYPILWEGDSALIFIANVDGYASYGRPRADLSNRVIPRRDAVERFFARWDRFQHIGDVPDELERQIILNENALTESALSGRMAAPVDDVIKVPDIDQQSDGGASSCGDASPPVRCILMTFGQKDSAPALRKQEQLLSKRFKWLIDTGCVWL